MNLLLYLQFNYSCITRILCEVFENLTRSLHVADSNFEGTAQSEVIFVSNHNNLASTDRPRRQI